MESPLFSHLSPLRFTLIAQSLFQIKRQLDKLGELVVKVTYECDPIPLQKPQLEERVKYLIYHLIKRYSMRRKYNMTQVLIMPTALRGATLLLRTSSFTCLYRLSFVARVF